MTPSNPGTPAAANPLRSYQTISTQTAPPGQLVLMLYDGAIRFLERAIAGFEHEDPLEFNATIHNNITRVQEIIQQLSYSLDLAQGGELARTLHGLYDYMHRQLTLSNVRKTSAGLHDTLHRLSILRQAWSQMLREQGSLSTGPESTATMFQAES